MAGFVVSSAGFIAFTYGRRMQRVPHTAIGLLLMIFPMFVGSAALMTAIGTLLMLGLWFAVRLGW